MGSLAFVDVVRGGIWRVEVEVVVDVDMDLGRGIATRDAFFEKMAVVVMIFPVGAALVGGFRRAGAGLAAALVVFVVFVGVV